MTEASLIHILNHENTSKQIFLLFFIHSAVRHFIESVWESNLAKSISIKWIKNSCACQCVSKIVTKKTFNKMILYAFSFILQMKYTLTKRMIWLNLLILSFGSSNLTMILKIHKNQPPRKNLLTLVSGVQHRDSKFL